MTKRWLSTSYQNSTRLVRFSSLLPPSLNHSFLLESRSQSSTFSIRMDQLPPESRSSSRSPSVSPPVPTATTNVNLHLMRSCALRAAGYISRALNSAEQALSIATEHSLYHLICKCHLYRGLCMMQLSRWKEASNDFTRAANVRGWAGSVSELKLTAEKNLLEEMNQKSRQQK